MGCPKPKTSEKLKQHETGHSNPSASPAVRRRPISEVHQVLICFILSQRQRGQPPFCLGIFEVFCEWMGFGGCGVKL